MSTPLNQGQGATAVVLFCDVSGSTRLYESLGDALAFTRMTEVLALLRAAVEACGGEVIKTIGDELMCRFDDLPSALEASTALQTRIAAFTPESASMGVRIGLNAGPVIEHGGDVFGDAVNVAARVTAYARRGMVLATEDSMSSAPAGQRARFKLYGAVVLKGKRGVVELYEFDWRGNGCGSG